MIFRDFRAYKEVMTITRSAKLMGKRLDEAGEDCPTSDDFVKRTVQKVSSLR
jgi:hypothetical protein